MTHRQFPKEQRHRATKTFTRSITNGELSTLTPEEDDEFLILMEAIVTATDRINELYDLAIDRWITQRGRYTTSKKTEEL